jgi:type I restriction enzyme S subunit
VLKAAVDGRLTEKWRAAHPDVEPAKKLLERILAERRRQWEEAQLRKYAEKGYAPPKGWRDKYVAKVDAVTLPARPNGWCWATLAQLGELDRGKSKHRPRNAAHLYGGTHPFIQTGDIKEAGPFLHKYVQTYSDAGLKQSKLWPAGTLCITIAANIAETTILGIDACFPDSVVGFVPSESISVRYVQLQLQAVRRRIEAMAPATAQKNINLEVLSHSYCVNQF